MKDHLSIALTLALLIGGTAAIGSELLGLRQAPTPPATAVVMLPAVTVIGHRQPVTTVAAASRLGPPQRVQ